MSGDASVAPIIIKRKKVSGGDGHHGGAWKVAYADFVTAMMAFFLLMWLLNATTEKQRKGIADYFTPTVAMARVSGGGDGALGGDSVFSENVLPQVGTGSTSLRAQTQKSNTGGQSAGENESAEDAAKKEEEEQQYLMVKEKISQLGKESVVTEALMTNLNLEVTDEGLVIEIFDTEEVPLFLPDGTATQTLRDLAFVLVEASKIVTNGIAIEGHTASYPVVVANDPSWDVSGMRAALLRDLMSDKGMNERRVHRITAHADREPSYQNRMDVRNNRLEVIFLRAP